MFLSNWQEAWGPTEFLVALEERHTLLPCQVARREVFAADAAPCCWGRYLLAQGPVDLPGGSQGLMWLPRYGEGFFTLYGWHCPASQATLRYFPSKTSLLWERKLHSHFLRPQGAQKLGSWQHFERKHLLFFISMSALRAVLYLINFGS